MQQIIVFFLLIKHENVFALAKILSLCLSAESYVILYIWYTFIDEYSGAAKHYKIKCKFNRNWPYKQRIKRGRIYSKSYKGKVYI